LAGLSERAFGEVRLTRPLSLSVLCGGVTLMALAVVAWMVLGQYTRKAHVSGVLVPDRGMIRLVVPQAARVIERRVAVGDVVHVGDVLFVLSLERETRGVETGPLRTEHSLQSGWERAQAGIDQERGQPDGRREVLVRSPGNGTLSAVFAEAGQSVAPDAVLASVLPAEARLQAQLFAPSSAVGLLETDQPVQLRVAAFPYQKFGHQIGRIVRISGVPLQESEIAAMSSGGTRPAGPLYRITVALERAQVTAFGQPRPLMAGMEVDADVLLERRSLIEWVFQPLIGLFQRG
jgi:membrane fusion protein